EDAAEVHVLLPEAAHRAGVQLAQEGLTPSPPVATGGLGTGEPHAAPPRPPRTRRRGRRLGRVGRLRRVPRLRPGRSRNLPGRAVRRRRPADRAVPALPAGDSRRLGTVPAVREVPVAGGLADGTKVAVLGCTDGARPARRRVLGRRRVMPPVPNPRPAL